ncbi:hypothetical protein Pelo_19344 [Pelomyxa schiedti]|nr:hypothetical protein Pelo_19344 [Pelomyxa schiedti]
MKNGEHCFVVKTSPYVSVSVVSESSSAIHIDTKLKSETLCDVSQLSESLFCISGEFAEIWDCNNVAKPLRIITFADLGDVEERDNFGWKGNYWVVIGGIDTGCCPTVVHIYHHWN